MCGQRSVSAIERGCTTTCEKAFSDLLTVCEPEANFLIAGAGAWIAMNSEDAKFAAKLLYPESERLLKIQNDLPNDFPGMSVPLARVAYPERQNTISHAARRKNVLHQIYGVFEHSYRRQQRQQQSRVDERWGNRVPLSEMRRKRETPSRAAHAKSKVWSIGIEADIRPSMADHIRTLISFIKCRLRIVPLRLPGLGYRNHR